MILSPMNVELTKVHFYESSRMHRNHHVTASGCEVVDNNININIKRNIFGQKSWTFNVNSTESQKLHHQKYKRLAIIFTVCVLFALFASVSFTAIYLRKIPQHMQIIPQYASNTTRVIVFDQSELNVEAVLERQRPRTQRIELHDNTNITNRKPPREKGNLYVCDCKMEEVCLRQKKGTPLCVRSKDVRDPSGCGGICKLNTQHCRLLDKQLGVYECAENGGGLRCPLGYFNCANSLCIHGTRVCDGVVDCLDLSDEKDCSCNLETHFHCGQGTSCLAKWQRCDGKVDCWDTSDEIDCPQRANCPPGQLSCGNSTQCFHQAQFCDGTYDCVDKSDEICFQNP